MTRMKFHKKGNTFRFPDVEDTGTHRIEDVFFFYHNRNVALL